MKLSFIGNNLPEVSKLELGRASFCCVQAIMSLEALGDFVDSVTIDFVNLNGKLGPVFRFHFKGIQGKDSSTTTDFRLIRENKEDQNKEDEKSYADLPDDFIANFLADEIRTHLPKMLKMQILDLEGAIKKIKVACPAC